MDIADDMSARGHGALARLVEEDVDDAGEEVCFAVLAAEMLGWLVSWLVIRQSGIG